MIKGGLNERGNANMSGVKHIFINIRMGIFCSKVYGHSFL